jgi:hypothetical protein
MKLIHSPLFSAIVIKFACVAPPFNENETSIIETDLILSILKFTTTFKGVTTFNLLLGQSQWGFNG